MTTSSGLIREGCIVIGSLFSEPMRVETVRAGGEGTWTVGLVGMQSERFRKVTLSVHDLEGLTILDTGFTYRGDGRLMRLGLQAYSLGIAWEFDPYFGLSISRVDTLPHQQLGGPDAGAPEPSGDPGKIQSFCAESDQNGREGAVGGRAYRGTFPGSKPNSIGISISYAAFW
ncbi:MAG: hypothetical protein ACLP2P_00570 [Desulfobaccales bacterium]